MRRQGLQLIAAPLASRIAGPSNLTRFTVNKADVIRRQASTAAAASAPATPTTSAAASTSASRPYPFAPTALTHKRLDYAALRDGQVPVQKGKFVRSSRGLMAAVNAQLRSQYDPDGTRTALIARRSKQNIIAGSILNVETWNDASKTTFSTFAGVVLAIRHRNTSSSITLRNVVNKTGVEVTFNVYSPLIKDVRVIARAHTSKREGALRRVRRAKLYYLRHDEKRLPNVARAIQVARAREERDQQATVRAQELLAKGA